jgi:putative glutamine amidotransferase
VTDCVHGTPLAIPVLAEHLDIDELLRLCDGILFTGSPSDIEPHHYAGTPSAPGTLHDPDRDALTLPLARRALETGVPVFAICRGFQELNVALGGSLHQKVADVPGFHSHKENPDDPLEKQYGPSHDVVLAEDGFLRSLTRHATVLVNSLHGQGIAQLAAGLVVEATADDGLVEAFRVDDAPGFNLAVQWHPEWRAAANAFSVAMFRAFGDACRERAAQRQV